MTGEADPDPARREARAVQDDHPSSGAGGRTQPDLRRSGERGQGRSERQDREAREHRGEGGANVHNLTTLLAPSCLRADGRRGRRRADQPPPRRRNEARMPLISVSSTTSLTRAACGPIAAMRTLVPVCCRLSVSAEGRVSRRPCRS
jgi:hypothetical protein